MRAPSHVLPRRSPLSICPLLRPPTTHHPPSRSKCKFYRFDAGAGEWKERGIGQARLLRHKAHGRVRFLMREATTLKVRANHLVLPSTTVKEHEGSEKAAVWSCVDFAEGEQRPEMFCARFASAERAAEFRAAYGDAAAHNAPLLAAAGEGGEESEGETGEEAAAAAPSAADEAADALAKATVADAAEPEAAA
jgi:Ran-binding protein 1